MIRIVRIGKIPPEKEKYKKCRNCKTEITYKESDIKYDMEYDEYVECPLCHQMIRVSIFDRKVKK